MIPLFKPYYDDREVNALSTTLKSGWLGLGKKTQQFEEAFAALVGSKYAIAVNSCTAALHLAVKLLDIKEGDEVLVPTLTFVSTAHVARYVGAQPIFCDIEESTLQISQADCNQKITSDTKAIIPILYGGQPLDLPHKNIPIIYDCAHAGGANFSAADKLCCWSFHAVKNIALGDGGMLTTDDEDYYDRARRLRWLGIDKGTWERAKVDGYQWEYNVEEVGFKYHMNDIAATLGLVQLDKLPEMQRLRRKVVDRYYRELEGVLTLPKDDPNSSWHLFVVRTPKREELAEFLKIRGIATGVHYKPIHLYPCYNYQGTIPVAERVWQNLLSLPIYPGLKEEELTLICSSIREFFK
jgi:perosamine synthetase